MPDLRPLPPVAKALASLAIHASLDEIRSTLAHGSAVLCAPPGSGKSTGVPLALLHESWLGDKKIIMLEPRRLAARAAAARMSALLGQETGGTVGYTIRFDRRISPFTRIEVVTEGILTRRIQQDPELADIGLVIFDEFHERSLHADLALALCLELCSLRDDLRLLVMSATLDADPIATLLGGVPVITGHGQSFPVEIEYLNKEPAGRIAETTVQGIRQVLEKKNGDILAFLPGAGEIKQASAALTGAGGKDILIQPLYGNLSQQEQDRAILPDPLGRRRVVLATSIAETSLTIDGILNVVDSGWSRLPRFRPASGMSGLDTVRVSRAAARQRTGRAGRVAPGFCLRLWTLHQHHGLVPFHPPEICAADLASLLLELALWGVADPLELRWLDPPPASALSAARAQLTSLHALDETGGITPTGRQLAGFPIHPRLAHMLVMAGRTGQGLLACDLAALLSERDIIQNASFHVGSDLQYRLQILQRFRDKGRDEKADPAACRRVDTSSLQYRRLLEIKGKKYDEDKAGLLLAFAYPDRIAGLRPGGRERYQLSGGKGALLPSGDPMAGSPFLVAPLLDTGQREGKIFLAAPVDINELRISQPGLFAWQEIIGWDEQNGRVTAVRREYLGELVIREEGLVKADPGLTRAAMLEGIRRMGIESLPWSRETRRLQARINSLRFWQPEGNWPQIDDEHLMADLAWLSPYLDGISRREQLKQLDLNRILLDKLDWRGQQELDQAAPERLQVPSGSRILLDYRPGEAPVLAVRLQGAPSVLAIAVTSALLSEPSPLVSALPIWPGAAKATAAAIAAVATAPPPMRNFFFMSLDLRVCP